MGLMLVNELLTQHEAAKRTGHHPRTIRKWVEAGRLVPAHQFPGPKGLKLFRAEDVDRAARNDHEQAS